METRANHLWVGIVTLLLLAALAAGILTLSSLRNAGDKQYDIFFPQAVEGLVPGSIVTFAGVPVGKVDEMKLWEKDPQFVRVRINVDPDVPILQGTTAAVLGSFTGVSTVQLDGARAGAPPITKLGRAGVPEIRPTQGGLGAILSGAPELLNRLSILTERLTQFMSPENQASLTGILNNTEALTASTADIANQTAPEVQSTLRELRATLGQSTETLAAFEQVLGSTDRQINAEGQALADELRRTLQASQTAIDQLAVTTRSAGALMEDTRPAARQLSEQTLPASNEAIRTLNEETLPAAEATLRDLRATSKALRDLTEKLDQQGAAGIVGGSKLPDYKPK